MPDLQLIAHQSIGVAIYPAGASFGPRAMNEYEFVWVIEGNARYTVDDTTHLAPEGSIVLCKPGTRDFFLWDPGRPTKHAFFHFGLTGIPHAWRRPADWPVVVLPEEGDTVRVLFKHVVNWSRTGDSPLRLLSMGHILTAFVLGQSSTRELAPQSLPEPVDLALKHLKRRMESDPAGAIDLEELADAAFVTPEHLCRLFKSATGKSPAQTVRLARLDRAATFLARSNYSINEIAELCGFASPFHFSRRFKEAFGQSPRAARKAIHAGALPPLSRLLRTLP